MYVVIIWYFCIFVFFGDNIKSGLSLDLLNIFQYWFTVTSKQDLLTNSFMRWTLKSDFLNNIVDSKETMLVFDYRTQDADGLIFAVGGQSDQYINFEVRIIRCSCRTEINKCLPKPYLT